MTQGDEECSFHQGRTQPGDHAGHRGSPCSLHSPFSLLLLCLPGKLGWRKLDKKVPGPADQSLVRKVLWDLGQEVVHRGHVALAVQDFLLPVQHDLQGGPRALSTAGEAGMTPCHPPEHTSEPEEERISLLSGRPALPRGDALPQSTAGRWFHPPAPRRGLVNPTPSLQPAPTTAAK